MSDQLTAVHQTAAADISFRLFVVRWMEHEYESGWGVTDQESHLAIYKTDEDVASAINKHFKNNRSLQGAGDYFTYPSGPNDAYNVTEIYFPPEHELFGILKTHSCVDIPRLPEEDKWIRLRRDIILQMQNPTAKRETVPFFGLRPKPMTEDPVSLFPLRQP